MAVEPTGNGSLHELSGVLLRKSLDTELRQPVERLDSGFGRLAYGEEKHDPFGAEPTSDEGEGLGRCPVEPLFVVDDAHERLVSSHL